LTETIHTQVVRRASELFGPEGLADRVDVSFMMVRRWLAGSDMPGPREFLKIMSLIRSVDPTYRPVESAR
jgi:hypothetical protein